MKNKKQLKLSIKKWLKNKWILAIFLIISLLLIITSAVASYQLIYFSKIYPRISVLDLNLSGKNTKIGFQLLNQKLIQSQIKNIYFQHENNQLTVPVNSIKTNFLIKETVNQAYTLGRNQSSARNLLTQARLLKNGQSLNLQNSFNEKLLKDKLATISAQISIPVLSPSISIDESSGIKQIIIQKGQDGQTLDWPLLYKLIKTDLGQLKEPDISVPIQVIRLAITDEQIKHTKARAKLYLNKKIVLKHEEDQWLIDDHKIVSFLNYDNGFNQEKIASFAAFLAKSTDRPAQNALFEFDNNQVKAFTPAKTGIKLNQTSLQDLILKSLNELKEEENQEIKISLPTFVSQPDIATADSNSFGISDLIGKGESWFSHSIPSRIHNVDLASSKFHGLLIPPGEEFSFNQTVGDISLQSGYKQAYIIKEGRTILGDGGGVCQVSTTLFRAALGSGLEIIQRSPHAYRVSYYEENSPVGLDATVFDPSPDLKFKNNTKNHILIQRVFNPSSHYLSFSFYGHPDNRTIYISKSRLWDQSPPPPDLYQEDPTLALGIVKQIDWAAWGAKAAFDYKVALNDEVLQEKTFYSTYRPWQAIYLRGTKTN